MLYPVGYSNYCAGHCIFPRLLEVCQALSVVVDVTRCVFLSCFPDRCTQVRFHPACVHLNTSCHLYTETEETVAYGLYRHHHAPALCARPLCSTYPVQLELASEEQKQAELRIAKANARREKRQEAEAGRQGKESEKLRRQWKALKQLDSMPAFHKHGPRER